MLARDVEAAADLRMLLEQAGQVDRRIPGWSAGFSYGSTSSGSGASSKGP